MCYALPSWLMGFSKPAKVARMASKLAVEEKVLTSDDPLLAQCLESYAVLLHKAGRDAEAQTMELRARTIREERAKR